MLERLYLSSYERLIKIFDELESSSENLEYDGTKYYVEDNLFKNFSVEKRIIGTWGDCLIFHIEDGTIQLDLESEISYNKDGTVFYVFEKGFWGY